LKNATAELNAQFEYREIDLALIDEPALAERRTMEELELAELAQSIKLDGLIKPLIVKAVGDRFEVVAGHRRLLACRIGQYSPVPCRVLVKGLFDPLAIMVSENAYTEPVNPIEEAEFYATLLTEKCNNDVDQLCLKVRRNRNFVEDRLLLLLGYPNVVDALRHRQLTIAGAKALNKCKDPVRLSVLLNAAVTQGATANQIAEWVREANGFENLVLPERTTNLSGENGFPNGNATGMICVFCKSAKHTSSMTMLWVHHVCLDMLNQLLESPQQLPPEQTTPQS
jgi:ParB/RepB/Spo0J family partition protein